MSEYIAPANVAIIIALVTSAVAILRTIAPRTKTTIDDDIVAFIDKARPWVHDFSGPIWALIEQLHKAGKIEKLNKFGEYMSVFREAFKDAFGKEMPEELEADAKLMARSLSAADKLTRPEPINPQSSLDAVK